MDPITLGVIASYVAEKFVAQFIKEEGYGKFKLFFFPKEKYISRLERVIVDTVTDFEKIHPVQYGEKFPFYHSQILFDTLNNHLLFQQYNSVLIIESFTKNPFIIIPTETQLQEFYKLFIEKVKSDKKLKKLYIEDYYKEEIFKIAPLLDQVNKKLDMIQGGIDRLIDSNKQEVLLYPGYIQRDSDEALIKLMEEKHILLLTGISFCGKTETAKMVASHFVGKGYEFRVLNTCFEAAQFLRNNNKRIVLLEDPFGHNIETEDSGEWKKLNDLLHSISSPNKLIITSRLEILKSINGVSDVAECSIENNHWIDITSKNKDFLRTAWKSFCNHAKSDIYLKIDSYLERAAEIDLLQVGQLYALSRYDKQELQNKSLDQLLTLARKDSKQISIDIERRGDEARKLFTVLAISADTFQGIHLDELNYIFSDNNDLPGIEAERDYFRRERSNQYPQYKDVPVISDSLIKEIGFFESRGFITIINGKIFFTHPNYREAGRILLTTNRTDYWTIIIHYFKQALSCLHPITARNSLKQIEILLSLYKEDKKNNLLALLVDYGINSIFPGVRDISFIILLENLDSLNEQQQDRVLNRINYDYADYNIFWNGEFPYITEDYRLRISDLNDGQEIDWNALQEKFDTNSYSVNDLWILINASKRDKRKISKENALKILSAEESFVRARFVTLNFSNTDLFDNSLIEQVFKDGHPSVIFAAVAETLIYYPNFDHLRKLKLRGLLLEAFKNQYVLIRSNSLITTFGIDYGSESMDWESISEEEKPEIWSLWSLLICAFFANAAPTISISNEGRFYVTIEKAKDYLNATQGLNVAEAYFFHYQQFVKGLSIPYWLSSPVNITMMLTSSQPEIREELFKSIFTQKSTPFILDNLALAIAYWDFLTENEKTLIKELISNDHPCKIFYHAICITRRIVPAEIQKIILGAENFLDKPVTEIYSDMERTLFEECIKVSFGIPHVYDNLALSNGSSLLWTNLLKQILKNPKDNLFKIAVETMLYDIINTASEHWRKDGIEIWKQLCDDYDPDILLQKLIEATTIVNFSISHASALWKVIEDKFRSLGKIEVLVSEILNNIEALQTHMEAHDFFEVFSKELGQLIIEKSVKDNAVLSLCLGMLKRGKSEKDHDNDIASIISETKDGSLKLVVTFNFINRVIDELNLSEQQRKQLETIPNRISEIGDKKQEMMKEKYNGAFHYIPEKWLGAD